MVAVVYRSLEFRGCFSLEGAFFLKDAHVYMVL